MTNCILIYKGDKKVSKKEKAKKPFFKKWWFWLVAIIVIGGMIGATSDNEDAKEATSNNIETAEQVDKDKSEDHKEENEEKEEKKPINLKIDVNKELNFEQFDVTVKNVKVYEKKGKILADIQMDWTNRDYSYGDAKTFFVATLFDVKQNDVILEETNDSFNPENKISNDVFIPNAVGGTDSVRLTYELIDTETPIDIIFTPTTETEDSGVVTVELKQ